MSKSGKLITAIESARRQLSQSEQDLLTTNVLEAEQSGTVKAQSKLNRILGNQTVLKPNKPKLLSRVGVNNKPTLSLIADGVLGRNTDDYRPKLSLNQSSNDISSVVAQRLKDLRERTLNKISSDSSISESSFFGFESDGTPIWSSVVTGQRRIESGDYGAEVDDSINAHHHSVHIPITVEWPKQLEFSNHNTFKNWYTVFENKRATQLAEQIIGMPQTSLNPLVIIGESQTGKSHLLNAIGQATLVTSDSKIYMIRGEELSAIKSLETNWSDVFSHCKMLLIDDIDVILADEIIGQKLGRMIDYALNLNVHVIVTTNSHLDEWPASSLWDVLRGGVKTLISPVGAGSLMLYARQLSIAKNLILNDEQLAMIVTHGNFGWRAAKNSLELIENVSKNGQQIIDVEDIYKVLNNIQSDDEEIIDEIETEKVEDIANRLISSVLDVVYSDHDLGGVEINTELPELSDDYNPPNLDLDTYIKRDRDYVQTHIKNTLEDLTPEAPSVIDINDNEKHLVAKMNRIVEKDHSLAADILTEIDIGLDKQFTQSDSAVQQKTNQIAQLEKMLLELAERTSDASMEGLIGIADELRDLEHRLVSIDPKRGPLPEFIEDDLTESLESYTPQGDWNIDGQEIRAEDLIDSELAELIPIKSILEPHPEGAIRISTLTPRSMVLSGEEE